jgi:myosin-5
LNEPAILHSLHLRFKRDTIYTSIGDVLISINPFKRLPIYSDSNLASYQAVGEAGPRSDDTRRAPHIFQTADDAFRDLLISLEEGSPKDMSILVSGESGSGKTWTSKIAMKYLAVLSSKQQKKLDSFPPTLPSTSGDTSTPALGDLPLISPATKVQSATLEMQVLQSNPILEAFGNARTIRNDNSSRFGKFIEIGFTDKGVLSGAQIETYLLEKSRVLAQSTGERNFHVFYLLLAGASPDTLAALSLDSTDASDFAITNDLRRRDGVKDKDCFTEMMEAFEHLAFDETTTLSILKLIAAVLHLSKVTFDVGNNGGEGESSSVASTPAAHSACRLLGISMETLSMGVCYKTITVMKEVVNKPLNVSSATKSVQALMTTIYASLFSTIVDKINTSISVETASVESSKAASISILDIFGFESFESNHFEQLMINFTNETLQQQFNRQIFKREQELYVAENIDWNFIDFPDNTDVLTLLDGRYPSVMSILDEQCVIPKSSDAKFARSLYKHLLEKEPFEATRVEQGNEQFTVHHYARSVCYDASGFLAKNTDDIGNSLTVINTSELALLKEIASSIKSKSAAVTVGKRKTSVSSGRKFSNSLKSLRLRIEQTKPIFVRCIKPNDDLVADKFQARNVVEQLRCSGVLSAVEVSRAGYSNRFTHQRFMDRFYMIAPDVKSLATLLETSAIRIFEPTSTYSSVVDFRTLKGDLNPKLMHVGIQLGKTLVF